MPDLLRCLSGFALLGAGCTFADCEVLLDGVYTVDAPEFAEPLQATLRMDEDACTFTLDDWSAQEPSMPDSGRIREEEAFLLGDDPYWVSCFGEIAPDGLSVDGICFGGEPFSMASSR